jgi:hypothetical protein
LKDASVYFATELDRARMRGERVGEQVVRELGRGA